MKRFILIAFFLPLLFVFVSCNFKKITTDKAQTAVDKALDFTKKGGNVRVTGVRELPQENAAQVDLQFNGFQYNTDMMGVPISKNQTTPAKPELNSPNYWQEVLKYGTEQTGTKNYSGQGTATFKRYNDGRWALTVIQFNFVSVTANIEVGN